ncbi:diacylglycerol/lipid kinase family protein [Candidatus Bipolaricaulota sp. J31]
MKIAVILNPTADRGRAGGRRAEIERGLARRDLVYELFVTRGPGHATELARAALEAGFSAVVAAGGDGTLNEVAQALVGSGVPMGIIPCGSGNDFVKGVGIPGDMEGALDVLARGRIREVDVGAVEADGLGARYFINCFGAGIDGQIALDYKRMRLLRGELGYLWAAVLELFRFRGVRARVEADGWRYEGVLALLPLQNGPYAGGGFHMAPGAAPDDGLLDLVLVEDRSVPRRFPLLVRFRDGTYLRLSGTRRIRVREVQVELTRPVPAHLDGETLPKPVSSLRAKVHPGALRVIC